MSGRVWCAGVVVAALALAGCKRGEDKAQDTGRAAAAGPGGARAATAVGGEGVLLAEGAAEEALIDLAYARDLPLAKALGKDARGMKAEEQQQSGDQGGHGDGGDRVLRIGGGRQASSRAVGLRRRTGGS